MCLRAAAGPLGGRRERKPLTIGTSMEEREKVKQPVLTPREGSRSFPRESGRKDRPPAPMRRNPTVSSSGGPHSMLDAMGFEPPADVDFRGAWALPSRPFLITHKERAVMPSAKSKERW